MLRLLIYNTIFALTLAQIYQLGDHNATHFEASLELPTISNSSVIRIEYFGQVTKLQSVEAEIELKNYDEAEKISIFEAKIQNATAGKNVKIFGNANKWRVGKCVNTSSGFKRKDKPLI